MTKIKKWMKEEAVLAVAAMFAAVSMFFVPPDMEYIGYISYDVLAVLFCLMAVVAGFISAGVFDYLSDWLLGASGSYCTIAGILTAACPVHRAACDGLPHLFCHNDTCFAAV